MTVEYERRFLVKTLPEGIPDNAWQTIRQGYLAIDAAGEVRIREEHGLFTLTAKKGEGSAREEAEIEISAPQFEALWSLARDRSLHKRRYALSMQDATLFIDEYLFPVRFLLAEMEYKNESVMHSLPLPECLGPEVTDIATMRTFPLLIERVKRWQIMGE